LSEDEQLIAVGIGAFNDGLYEIAEKNLSEFIKVYPQHKKFYDVSYLLGRTYLMNGKWREARTSFLRIFQDNKFENLDHEYVATAVRAVGNLQVHSHFGGEYYRDAGGAVKPVVLDYYANARIPDYAHYIGLMGEIGYNGVSIAKKRSPKNILLP
jgi:outer membrane protein assembly factor BamD (BamD/ComL family)